MMTTPPVVKNLIIINVLFFMAQALLPDGLGDMIARNLALYSPLSDNFRLYQIITYMFLHANFTHLLMNMFAFWMFGRTLEYDLGSKRFLSYYLITGIGAALLHMGINTFEIMQVKQAIVSSTNATPYMSAMFASRLNAVTVGASGAVYGILLAFGVLHPNSVIMLLIPPIPIKAKWFVVIYGVLELFMGVVRTSDGIAHFAHVGGMIFGFLLLHIWKRKGEIYF